MKHAKKILAGGAIVAALGTLSPAAQAFTWSFDVLNGAGGTIASDVYELDWNSGSTGIALGKGPVGSNPGAVGSQLTFYYMSNLVAFNDQQTNPLPFAPGLNVAGGYEFTIVASITETVTNVADLDGIPGGPGTVTFGGPFTGTISIFFDNLATGGGVRSNQSSGVGYDDGIEILRMNITGGNSSFTLFNLASGNGGTNYDFKVSAVTDFLDTNYISGLPTNVSMRFTSSQNFPPTGPVPNQFFTGTSDNNGDFYPTYVTDKTCTPLLSGGANSCDLALKIDGSSTFVPEPASMFLMGAGLLGMSFATRRKAAKKAG